MEFNILQCKYLMAPYTTQKIERIVKDYEIDFFVGARRELFVDSVKYNVNEGDICFRTPGQKVYGLGDNAAYLLTLDFSNRPYIKHYSRNTAKEFQPICDSELLRDIPCIFRPRNIEKYKFLFSILSLQLDRQSDVSKAVVMEILYRINADLKHDFYEKNASEPSAIGKVAQYIQLNYNQNINIDTLAKIACLDRSYLIRSFKKEYKKTPISYMIGVRLNNARDMLLNSDLPVAQIAERCGYNSESFFIQQYKKKFGATPYSHRKEVWGDSDKYL